MPPPRKKITSTASAARVRVLAQWHGLDYAPLEAARATPARRADAVLPAVLKDLRLETHQAGAEIIKVWNALLDPVITAHAQPVNLRRGTLFVHVDSSAWLAEIVRYRRKEILDRLQHGFGRAIIQRISFRLG